MAEFNNTTNLEEFELTKEQMEELLASYYASPIILNQDDIENNEKFKAGVDKSLGICGMITAFVSTGISQIDAINLVVSMLNAETSVRVAELSVEAAKNTPVQYVY